MRDISILTFSASFTLWAWLGRDMIKDARYHEFWVGGWLSLIFLPVPEGLGKLSKKDLITVRLTVRVDPYPTLQSALVIFFWLFI